MTNCEECNDPVDVIIETSDGKFHGTHSKNLELYTDAFPPASLADPNNINHIQLTESSEVIKLMLKYVHKQPQPDSEEIGFEVMKDLAEAVEKYQIYPAMEVCRLHMKSAAKSHPLEVLGWATRHDYMAIADKSAPWTLGKELGTVSLELGPATGSWVHYREPYLHAIKQAQKRPIATPPSHLVQHRPERWESCTWTTSYRSALFQILSKLLDDPRQMHTITLWGQGIRPDPPCSYCPLPPQPISDWFDKLKGEAESIPAFSTVHRTGRS